MTQSPSDDKSCPSNDGSDYEYNSPVKKKKRDTISKERKIEIIELWDTHPSWKWDTLKKNGCPEVPNQRTLYGWQSQVRKGQNKREKMQDINAHVYNEFLEARKSFKILRSSHLRQFPIQKYLEINDLSLKFKATSSWLDKFKKRNRISSRKITQLVSKREVKSGHEILEAAKKFQAEIIKLSQNYDKDQIFNTDQCGFQYELTSARTLTNKNEKIVFGYSQSPKNLATHSYTVQYIIRMAGYIIGNVFVCLQEPGGKFGPRFQSDVNSYLPCNVTVTCSTSGKLSTSLNEYFIEKQLVSFAPKKFIHIVDSWAGHTNFDSYTKYFGEWNDTEILLKIIPEKCTPHAQPLDTTFHRQLKNLAREILSGLEIYLNVDGVNQKDNGNTRKGVIKLFSAFPISCTNIETHDSIRLVFSRIDHRKSRISEY